MRYVDLALAALIGTSALTGIVAWDPATADSNSRRLRLQSAVRDEVASFLQEKGTFWFLSSPPDVVCSTMAGMSNSTSGFAVSVGSLSCGPPPPIGSVSAELGERLGSLEVTVVGWSLG